jgi:hypothetical protein
MQQRGITPAALDCLLEYGREAHDHNGAVTLYFDKAARQRAARIAGTDARKRIAQFARLYAVLGRCGEIVTVGHRYRRINRS